MASKDMISKMSDTEIAQMFSDYVARMQDKERHTRAACKEADAFDTCCASEFPNNVRLQNLMYNRMMDVAVEFEESGFIAGFKTAAALLFGQEQDFDQSTQISTPKRKQRQHKAVNDSQKENMAEDPAIKFKKDPSQRATFAEDSDYINTVQIAKMFSTSNAKVVNRIEQNIIPYYSEDIGKHFLKVDGYNIQHKKVVFYKLDATGCMLYMKAMETSKKFVNVAGGCAKMQELMEKMFPAEKLMRPA